MARAHTLNQASGYDLTGKASEEACVRPNDGGGLHNLLMICGRDIWVIFELVSWIELVGNSIRTLDKVNSRGELC